MLAIFNKEITNFFSSASGYIILCLFLIGIGLISWVIPGPFNNFDWGYASLHLFFEALPWVFSFLIPAVCMRSFSEEQKQGTLEILLTKPITLYELVLGKYLGLLCIALVALLPTLLYLVSLSALAAEDASIDYGVIFSSYFGVVLLLSCFTAIGIFASSLTKNQVVAFLLGSGITLILFFGFSGLPAVSLFNSQLYTLEYFSLSYHYKSISRGVLDSRSLFMLLSYTILFLALTRFQLQSTLR